MPRKVRNINKVTRRRKPGESIGIANYQPRNFWRTCVGNPEDYMGLGVGDKLWKPGNQNKNKPGQKKKGR